MSTKWDWRWKNMHNDVFTVISNSFWIFDKYLIQWRSRMNVRQMVLRSQSDGELRALACELGGRWSKLFSVLVWYAWLNFSLKWKLKYYWRSIGPSHVLTGRYAAGCMWWYWFVVEVPGCVSLHTWMLESQLQASCTWYLLFVICTDGKFI